MEIPKFNLDSWNPKEVVKINSPLAVCLAYDWLTTYRNDQLNGFGDHGLGKEENIHKFSATVIKYLDNFQFPGRCQTLNLGNLK